jgi:hypothetical protein
MRYTRLTLFWRNAKARRGGGCEETVTAQETVRRYSKTAKRKRRQEEMGA